ncbi:MAG: polyprenyl synthetase family protein [Flavobacterium sp.]
MLSKYQEFLEKKLSKQEFNENPKNLYEPIDYIMKLSGKRIRPILVLLASDAYNHTLEDAWAAALSVEIFHNFSLVHDDIMDHAPLRRGNITVHEKWDTNVAILSGDAMLILAIQKLEYYNGIRFENLIKLLCKTALQVCEGQQMDVDFETMKFVLEEDYITMISKKTAVLVAASLQMGAIVADATIFEQENIYNFGLNLGIAFQLQDDYLDAFGNPETFGKKVGGDIIENKKTYLFIKSLESNDEKLKQELLDLYKIKDENESKIEKVKNIFITTGASQKTLDAIEIYTNKALKTLELLSITEDKKQLLQNFANYLMKRKQ